MKSKQDEIQGLTMSSPVGPLHIKTRDHEIIRLTWRVEDDNDETAVLLRAREQLQAYFAGELIAFDLPLKPAGGEFQQRVHDAMSAIPYGQTRSYGDLAAELNSAAQPVGNACGRNPIPIIIPCHRVLAANNLGGFSGEGGVETKLQLLRLENAVPNLI